MTLLYSIHGFSFIWSFLATTNLEESFPLFSFINHSTELFAIILFGEKFFSSVTFGNFCPFLLIEFLTNLIAFPPC